MTYSIPFPHNKIADGYVLQYSASTGRFDPNNPSIPVFNVNTYGAVADCEPLFGFKAGSGGTIFATDNRPAFLAAYIAASAVGGIIYVPPGCYYFKGTLDFTTGLQPISITGAFGDGFTENTPALLVFPSFQTLDNGAHADITTGSCLILGPGSEARNLSITQPQANAPLNWGQITTETYDSFIVPNKGFFGVVYHGKDTGVGLSVGGTEPNWPREWDVDTRFEVNDKIYVVGIQDSANPNLIPWRYKVTAASGNQHTSTQAGFTPYIGLAEKFVSGHTYTVGDSVRPTNANWTGYWFSVTAGTGAVTGEPAWPGPNLSVTQNGVTFTNSGLIWPRDLGVTTVDQSGTLSWQLDDTSGVFIDSAPTPIHWEVRAPVDGIKIFSTRLENINVYNIVGNGVTVLAGVGVPGDGWRADRVSITNVAGNGWYERGGDANVGLGVQISVHGAQGADIFADSFLGSMYEACEISPTNFSYPGRYGYRSTGINATNCFIGCYTEGGSAPSYFNGPHLILGRQGLWSFYPDRNLSNVLEVNSQSRGITSYNMTTGNQGNQWKASTKYEVGTWVYPASNPQGKRYQVNSSTNGAGGLGVSGSVEPAGFGTTTTTGATFTETNGSNVIVYQCNGSQFANIYMGSDTDPRRPLQYQFPDIKVAGNPISFGWMAGAPADGFVGFTYGGIVGNAIVAIDWANFKIRTAANAVGLGYGVDYREWTWTAASTNQVSDIFWNKGLNAQCLAEYFTVAGTPGTSVHAGKLYTDAKEEFRSVSLLWDTQNESDGYALPFVAKVRDGHVTNNATTTTIHTYSVPTDGDLVEFEVKIIAKRLDVIGDAAIFVLRGAWLRIGNALTIVDDFEIVKRSSTPGAGAWTAAIDVTSTTNIRVQVTGEANKVIHWSLVREILETS
jgi:hypothetical protein